MSGVNRNVAVELSGNFSGFDAAAKRSAALTEMLEKSVTDARLAVARAEATYDDAAAASNKWGKATADATRAVDLSVRASNVARAAYEAVSRSTIANGQAAVKASKDIKTQTGEIAKQEKAILAVAETMYASERAHDVLTSEQAKLEKQAGKLTAAFSAQGEVVNNLTRTAGAQGQVVDRLNHSVTQMGDSAGYMATLLGKEQGALATLNATLNDEEDTLTKLTGKVDANTLARQRNAAGLKTNKEIMVAGDAAMKKGADNLASQQKALETTKSALESYSKEYEYGLTDMRTWDQAVQEATQNVLKQSEALKQAQAVQEQLHGLSSQISQLDNAIELRNWEEAFDKIVSDTEFAATGLGKLATKYNEASGALTIIGAVVAAVGKAVTDSLKKSAMAAIDFDAAMAGVRKTTNSSDVEFAHLNDSVRELARTMPIAHTELAATMMMAGQLGVRGTEELTKFTKTAAMLGTATSMSADEAAQNLAQLMRIMGDQFTMVDDYANVVVALGNTTAATETQILNVAKRIGGAASVVGMTADQVLAISAAVLDVGINVELGGTAISRVLIEISNAISQGGKELDVWAKTAGMTAEQFKAAWANDVAGTFQQVISGFADMKDNGEDLFGVIGDLGVDGIRTISVLTQLAGAADNMGDKFNLAAAEMAGGSALLKEYGLFAQATAKKITVAKNAITELRIEFGENLAPAIEFVADTISMLATAAGALPEWLQTLTITLTGIGGAALLAGGGLMAATAQLSKAALAMQTAGLMSAALATKISALPAVVGAATGMIALLAAELTAIHWISNKIFSLENPIADINEMTLAVARFLENGQELDQMQRALTRGSGGATALDDLFRLDTNLVYKTRHDVTSLHTQISSIAEAAYVATQAQDGWWASLKYGVGKWFGATDVVGEYEQRVAAVQNLLLSMLSDGQVEEAVATYLYLVQEMRAGGRPVEQLNQDFSEFTAALELHNREQLVAAANAATLADATASIREVYDAFTEAQNEAHSGLTDLGAGFEAAVRIVQKYPTALDELVAKFGDFAGSIATQITEVSNLANAWEWARGELESPPDAQAWLDAIDQQIAAAAYFQQNTVAAYRFVADQVPLELQGVGADIVAALTPEQLDMFVNAFTPAQRAEFIAKSAQLGQFSGTEFATQMGESIMLNLPVISIEPQAETDLFVSQIQQAADSANITITPTITTPSVDGSPLALSPFNNYGPGRAAGGAITGGTPGKDSVPALLMPGEHVLTVADVNALGGQAGVYRLREQLGTPVQRFAAGGAVNPWPYGSMNNPTPLGGSYWPWPAASAAPNSVGKGAASAWQNPQANIAAQSAANKKLIDERIKLETKAADEALKAQLKTINAVHKAQTKAINDAAKAQIKAINDTHKANLKEINKAKKAEIDAIKAAEKAAQEIVDQYVKAADEAYRAWEQVRDQIASTFAGAAKEISNGTAAWQYAWDQQRLIAEGAARAAATLGLAWDDAFQPPNMGDWITAMQGQAAAFTKFTGLANKAMKQVKTELPDDMAKAAEAMLTELVALGPESEDALKVFTQASAGERQELIAAWMGTGSWLGENFGNEIADQTLTVQAAWGNYEQALAESLEKQEWFTAQGFENQIEIIENHYDQIIEQAENNRDSLIEIAQEARDAQIEAAGELKDAQIEAAKETRDALVEQTNQAVAGMKGALGQYQAYLNANPITAKVTVDTSALTAARAQAAAFNPWPVGSMNNPAPKTTYYNPYPLGSMNNPVKKADGGLIPGTPPANLAEDNVLMLGQSGEYVQQARSVDYYGLALMEALNQRKIPKEVLRRITGYASGGQVGANPAAQGFTIPAWPINIPQPPGGAGSGGNTTIFNYDIKNPQAESPSVTTNKVLAGLAVEY